MQVLLCQSSSEPGAHHVADPAKCVRCVQASCSYIVSSNCGSACGGACKHAKSAPQRKQRQRRWRRGRGCGGCDGVGCSWGDAGGSAEGEVNGASDCAKRIRRVPFISTRVKKLLPFRLRSSFLLWPGIVCKFGNDRLGNRIGQGELND
jgi:hypothetical protein